MSPQDIIDEIRAARSGETYRLYCWEWVIVHTVAGLDWHVEPFVHEVRGHFNSTYLGKVRPDDVRMEANVADPLGTDEQENVFWVHLKLRKPVLKGEFLYAFIAYRHAERECPDDFEVVLRDSEQDKHLAAYGTELLA